jgi:hypothetical protein
MDTLKISEAVTETISSEIFKREYVRNDFFRMLFWKNSHEPYVSIDQIRLIDEIADNYEVRGPEGEEYIMYDQAKALDLANDMRKQIGLPKLFRSIYGTLMEEK